MTSFEHWFTPLCVDSTLGKLTRDRVECIIVGFPKHRDHILNWSELIQCLPMFGWSPDAVLTLIYSVYLCLAGWLMQCWFWSSVYLCLTGWLMPCWLWSSVYLCLTGWLMQCWFWSSVYLCLTGWLMPCWLWYSVYLHLAGWLMQCWFWSSVYLCLTGWLMECWF